MANNTGWISLHRQIQSHWIWQDANKLKWWLDMLITVNSNNAKVNLGNEIFDCNRGESLLSLQGWGVRWGVSKDVARNFIRLLEKDGMVKCVSIGKSTRITICKYEDYQQVLHVNSPQTHRKHNAKTTQTHPNNKEDNNNNENNDDKNRIGVLFNELPPKRKSKFDLAMDKFVEMRLKKGKISDHAIVLIREKSLKLALGDEETAIEILNRSIINTWSDVFELKKENKNEVTKPIQPTREKFGKL